MKREPLITRDFSLAWLASFFEGLSWSLFIHLPGFLDDLGASEAQIGLIFGVAALAAVAVRPLVGQALDRLGRMPVIWLGNVINVGSILLYLTVSAIGPWVYFVRIIHGIGLATLFSAFFTYGADVVPESRRTEGFALFGVSGLLPIAAAGVIGDVVLNVAGFRELFLTAGAMAAVALLLSFGLRERRPEVREGKERRGFYSVVVRQSLRPVWLMAGGLAFVLTAYFTFLRTFVDETGTGTVGLFFATYGIAAILLRVFLGWLPERVGEKRVLYPSMGSLAVGFLVLAVASGNLHIGIAGVLCGVGHGFGFPILSGMVVSRAPDEDRGSAISFFTALFDLGVLVAGPVLGVIIGGFGYPTMFAFSAGILATVTVAFATWDGRMLRSRQAAPVPSE
ncbi:MAG: MFS transporter [bacterium]|nr:MFS transporter [bacterium]